MLKLCKKCAETILFYVFSRALKLFYGWAELALKICKNCAEIWLFNVFSRALKFLYWCAEFVLKLCKKCAQIFLFSHFPKMLKLFNGSVKFALKLFEKNAEKKHWIFFKTCTQNALKFYYFTFSQERWYFSTDVLNLCWNFVRNGLKFYYFTFSQKRWNFISGCAEFVLKLCKCAEILLFSRFITNAGTFQRICWICAETLWEIRQKKALNFFQDLYSKCAEILLFYVFSRALIFCVRMCWVCAETLQMRWNFFVFTFSQKCWNFSTDVLNLRWNFVRIALLF